MTDNEQLCACGSGRPAHACCDSARPADAPTSEVLSNCLELLDQALLGASWTDEVAAARETFDEPVRMLGRDPHDRRDELFSHWACFDTEAFAGRPLAAKLAESAEPGERALLEMMCASRMRAYEVVAPEPGAVELRDVFTDEAVHVYLGEDVGAPPVGIQIAARVVLGPSGKPEFLGPVRLYGRGGLAPILDMIRGLAPDPAQLDLALRDLPLMLNAFESMVDEPEDDDVVPIRLIASYAVEDQHAVDNILDESMEPDESGMGWWWMLDEPGDDGPEPRAFVTLSAPFLIVNSYVDSDGDVLRSAVAERFGESVTHISTEAPTDDMLN